MHAILVLNDGETWSPIGGSSVCFITDEQLQYLRDGGDPGDIEPPIEMKMESPWIYAPEGGDLSN